MQLLLLIFESLLFSLFFFLQSLVAQLLQNLRCCLLYSFCFWFCKLIHVIFYACWCSGCHCYLNPFSFQINLNLCNTLLNIFVTKWLISWHKSDLSPPWAKVQQLSKVSYHDIMKDMICKVNILTTTYLVNLKVGLLYRIGIQKWLFRSSLKAYYVIIKFVLKTLFSVKWFSLWNKILSRKLSENLLNKNLNS